MKKSELYKVAQVCILRDSAVSAVNRLEILRELMRREDTELFCEEQEAKREKADEAV